MSTDRETGLSALPSTPPESWDPLLRLARQVIRPLDRFLAIQASSGIVLLLAAAIALAWANSPWADGYVQLWATPVGVTLGPWSFSRPLSWVVNDGLMVVFFFVVGMEIRRELHQGELSEWRRAALPVAAALGGIIAPAALYLLLAGEPPLRSGWAVPMATDIAFALGVLALLGKRVPPALRVLLLAVAVIDDLGAILVIALFYAAGVSWPGLGVAALGLGAIVLLQRLGVRAKLAYVPPALVAWAGIYAAGLHPTIAGVLVGLLTPVRAWLGTDGFLREAHSELEALSKLSEEERSDEELAARLHQVDLARREARSPAESLIETLHPWVAYGIMPLFALANAGVAFSGASFDAQSWTVLGSVSAGLLLGKPLGLLLASALALRLGVANLPLALGWRHLVVLGLVAGIGFTMALFIAQLAFTEPRLLGAAKLGVLAASGLAAVGSLVAGRLLLAEQVVPGSARSADEAEASTTA